MNPLRAMASTFMPPIINCELLVFEADLHPTPAVQGPGPGSWRGEGRGKIPHLFGLGGVGCMVTFSKVGGMGCKSTYKLLPISAGF